MVRHGAYEQRSVVKTLLLLRARALSPPRRRRHPFGIRANLVYGGLPSLRSDA